MTSNLTWWKQVGLTVTIIGMAALGWNYWYVQPRQEFLLSVAECVGDNPSEAAWKQCSREVREQLSDSSTHARLTP